MTSRLGDQSIYEFGAFRLDPDERQLLRNGQLVPLTPKAFDLLVYLVQRQGKLVHKSALMAALWPDTSVEEANLAFQVSALRKALADDAASDTLIQTIPTKGYRFVAPVMRTERGTDVPISPHQSQASDQPERNESSRGLRGELGDVCEPLSDTSFLTGIKPAPVDHWLGRKESRETSRDASHASPTRLWPRRTALALAFSTAIVGLIAGVMWRSTRVESTSPSRVSLDVAPADSAQTGGVMPPAGIVTRAGSRTAFDWTPDGRSLVFAGQKGGDLQLYVRSLASSEAELLPGTQGGQVPVVSPDGKWVIFYAHRAIRKIPLHGGPVEVLASDLHGPPDRLAVMTDGRVFYGQNAPVIRQIGPSGTSDLTHRADDEVSHTLPTLLPGDDVLLYTVRRGSQTWNNEDVVAYTLSTGATKVLLHDATDARYVATGHLVFLRRGELLAVPFDRARLEVRGRPAAVLDGIAQSLASPFASNDITGAGQFAISATGTLAWIPGPLDSYPDRKLISIDRRGHIVPLPAPVRPYGMCMRISPNGRFLAVTVITLTDFSLWLFDMVRETLTKVTPGGEVDGVAWTPDSRHVSFGWLSGGRHSLAWLEPQASPSIQRLLTAGWTVPSSWLPDGRHVAFVEQEDEGNHHQPIRIAAIDERGNATSQPIDVYPESDSPEFSPDGRWLAYNSHQSGRAEVYVQPYPGPGPRLQVSTQGGGNPVWSRNGRELFFLTWLASEPDHPAHMMVVDVQETPPTLTLGQPRELFRDDQQVLPGCNPTRCFDIAPDGNRFFTIQLQRRPDATPVTHINLVFNWLDELKDKVSSGGRN
jgi:serine/threonine-protein kinase